MTTNVLKFPVHNSFQEGTKFGRLAAETGSTLTVAYGVAISESVYHREPDDYIRGFMQTFRAEEEKLELV